MESPENIQTIYERLKLRETMAQYKDWHIIGDLKAHNSSCGLPDKFGARHSCYICTGYKDQVTERWIKGSYRTFLTGLNDHSKFQECGGDLSRQKEFNNQVRDPIILTENPRTPFYKIFKPDPLHHIKLGWFYRIQTPTLKLLGD